MINKIILLLVSVRLLCYFAAKCVLFSHFTTEMTLMTTKNTFGLPATFLFLFLNASNLVFYNWDDTSDDKNTSGPPATFLILFLKRILFSHLTTDTTLLATKNTSGPPGTFLILFKCILFAN